MILHTDHEIVVSGGGFCMDAIHTRSDRTVTNAWLRLSNSGNRSIFFRISVLGVSWTSWGYKISGWHDWS